MEHIGERWTIHYLPFTDIQIPLGGVNLLTVGNTLLVMVILWVVLWAATRRPAWIPGRMQMAVEMVVGGWKSTLDALLEIDNKDDRKKVLGLVVSFFLFILVCNALPLIPLPYLEEPTSDLNCTVALALVSVTTATLYGIKYRGIKGYIEELCGPLWHQEGAKGIFAVLGKLSAIGFFPLHVVGELSRVLSLSCRLFGNIMGAAVIVTVVSSLTFGLFVPLGLDAFFLIFEAVLQAFVFSMLTLIYVAVATK